MMAVPPVMLPSVRRMLPVYTTQRLMSFFVMALLGISMSPINTAHAQLLLQPPAVIILAVFLLTFLSWLVSAINILVQQCCHRDTNGREDDYALLGKEPGLKLESEKQERQLAVALREAVASGDEILTTFLLQEGASVDGKHDPGVGVLELDLWRGQKFAEAMTGLEVQMCGRSAGLLTMNIPAPDDDGEWYYEVEIFQNDPASFRVGWAVPGDCMRMPEMGPFRPLGGLDDIGEDDSPNELSMVSSFAAAWVVEVTSGHILHTDGAGTSSKVAFLPEAKVLGCVAKIRSGTAQVFFVMQGDAGAEVTEACTFDIQGRTLLPAISVMGSSWHFKVNLGNEPFLLKPFGAAAVLTARSGDPPAVTAARNGHWTTCRLLLDGAADVNSMESIRRRTMLHYFADQGQEDAVRCLIQRQTDIWLQDSDEQDALTLAQSAETCRMILRAAGDRLKELLSRPSRGGWFTALHQAAEHGNAVLVRLLLEWRAEVDGPMPQTPLIWAAARGRKECAEILIRGRADVSRRDQAGLDALSWAEEAYVSKLGGYAKLPEEQCDALQKVTLNGDLFKPLSADFLGEVWRFKSWWTVEGGVLIIHLFKRQMATWRFPFHRDTGGTGLFRRNPFPWTPAMREAPGGTNISHLDIDYTKEAPKEEELEVIPAGRPEPLPGEILPDGSVQEAAPGGMFALLPEGLVCTPNDLCLGITAHQDDYSVTIEVHFERDRYERLCARYPLEALLAADVWSNAVTIFFQGDRSNPILFGELSGQVMPESSTWRMGSSDPMRRRQVAGDRYSPCLVVRLTKASRHPDAWKTVFKETWQHKLMVKELGPFGPEHFEGMSGGKTYLRAGYNLDEPDFWANVDNYAFTTMKQSGYTSDRVVLKAAAVFRGKLRGVGDAARLPGCGSWPGGLEGVLSLLVVLAVGGGGAGNDPASFAWSVLGISPLSWWVLEDHDHVVWVGDTNSRLHWPGKLGGMPLLQARQNILDKRYGELLALDQLQLRGERSREAGKSLDISRSLVGSDAASPRDSLEVIQEKNRQLRSNLASLRWPRLTHFQAFGQKYALPWRSRDKLCTADLSHPTQRQLAYLSGFFDGDGCVLSRASCQLDVSQSCDGAQTLMEFEAAFGGTIYRKSDGVGLVKPSLQWRLHGHAARCAARLLYPHSIVKRKQLQMASEPPQQPADRDCLAEELRSLKQYDSAISSAPSWEYFTGFFDAEGCLAHIKLGSIHFSISQKHVTVLQCLQQFLSCEMGIKAAIGMRSKQQLFVLTVTKASHCKQICARMLECGMTRKADQAKLVLELMPSNSAEVHAAMGCVLAGNQQFGRRLNLMRRDGMAFHDFEEHRICFLPSYKWHPDRDAYDIRSQKHVPVRPELR
ncbi:Receptor-interacting serine/threonine-protein kinase 4 [Symbiodinium microadriaticum]|uniref:Receptor-interacting serine/threonine-protein kinase 4 n=1 Tax=Symbiodinium microadriaticum TaxID=2951 RepID=A0A1Q9CFG4_SYMMI|nr:Receptor-interacting serine/threonine-protein kinase 4 [Symbiodinium microadriaticum]